VPAQSGAHRRSAKGVTSGDFPATLDPEIASLVLTGIAVERQRRHVVGAVDLRLASPT
jgi:hypothetical protein